VKKLIAALVTFISAGGALYVARPSPWGPRQVAVPRLSCTTPLVMPAGATLVTIDVDFHGAGCEVAVGW
jgi:hypothetical protein